MTLIIQKPTGAKLNLAQTYVGIDDPDAAVYVAAVEAADGQSLETATKVAIHSFVKGCKNDGIWPAIKASCILAGARTLTGALVPLVGTAPTNVDGLFVSGDYNRKTGLVGDGTSKYLNSNRSNNADPQNSKSLCVYVSSTGASTLPLIASDVYNTPGFSLIGRVGVNVLTCAINSASVFGVTGADFANGFSGASRSSSSAISYRLRTSNLQLITGSVNSASAVPHNSTINLLSTIIGGNRRYASSRLAFYSIGESLDLALLDARVTDLINAFAAAIP
jgi:hypothetical protein